MVQLEFNFNEREEQTAMQQLMKWMNDMSRVIPFNQADCWDKAEELLKVEEQQIRKAIMYALDEDGHTGEWKIKFANDYINNLKQ